MKRLLLLIVLSGLLLPLAAQTKHDTQIRQHINQAASALQTMQCDFVQTKHIQMLNDKLVSKGRMYYRQPDMLRWEYTSPYTYTFVINGDKVLLSNRQRNDVIDINQNKLFREIARIMMNTVVGKCLTDDKDFRTTLSETPSEWIATLVPQRKEMKGLFQKIILHFNRQIATPHSAPTEKAMVSQVELIEKKGDRTLIELKNVRTNEAVNASLFTVR